MYEKHYVIQWKMNGDSKWITLDNHTFRTLDDAMDIMEKKRKAGLPCENWRIAESYVVIRYKPVKF